MKNLLATTLLSFLFLAASAQPKYEFRGVWIATVDNIDWPQRNQFNVDSQKTEFIRQLDMHQRNGMNAVIVQVRPATDAFYPSPYEPWSQWLTGKQGRPPSPVFLAQSTAVRRIRLGIGKFATCYAVRIKIVVHVDGIDIVALDDVADHIEHPLLALWISWIKI